MFKKQSLPSVSYNSCFRSCNAHYLFLASQIRSLFRRSKIKEQPSLRRSISMTRIETQKKRLVVRGMLKENDLDRLHHLLEWFSVSPL